MAARKPLVLNAGKVQQLQAGDNLDATATDGLSSASGTAPLTLNLAAKALTGSIAITPTNPGGGVALQAATPGTQQTGHENLSGTVLAGKFGRTGGSIAFVLPSADGTTGQVIETDAAGNWVFGSKVKLQASTPGSAETGNINLNGVILCTRLALDAAAAGSTPLLIKNVASPTVNLVTFLLGGSSVPICIDKIGSLKTLEASRICPWIEPLVEGSATTINSTTAADITGLAFPTFTPGSDCRAEVKVCLDAKYATSGSGFLGELNVNTVADASQIVWNPQTVNERVPLTWVWQLVLSAGTSYAIKVQGKLSGGAGSFTIAAKSRMSAVIVGRL